MGIKETGKKADAIRGAMKHISYYFRVLAVLCLLIPGMTACTAIDHNAEKVSADGESAIVAASQTDGTAESASDPGIVSLVLPSVQAVEVSGQTAPEDISASAGGITRQEIEWDPSLPFADFSAIHADAAILYNNKTACYNGKTVCVAAGHGTSGGERVQTLCHPDGSRKIITGSTEAGSRKAAAVSGGMTFPDGIPEAAMNLKVAEKLRDKLLAEGYSVLMIRETEDVQLDNIARAVLANRYADCHVAIHFDDTEKDKGA